MSFMAELICQRLDSMSLLSLSVDGSWPTMSMRTLAYLSHSQQGGVDFAEFNVKLTEWGPPATVGRTI